jgi:hypothetical protein
MNKEDILNRFEEVKDELSFDNKSCLVYELRKLNIDTLTDVQISNLEKFVKSLPDDLAFDFLIEKIESTNHGQKDIDFLRKFKDLFIRHKLVLKSFFEEKKPKNSKKIKEYPPHLSFVEVEIHPGLKGFGRVYHNQDFYKTISVSGVTCDVDGVMHDKGFWFEWSIQLNHPHIKVKWKILQK